MKITELAKLSTAMLALGAFSAVGFGCESMGNDDSAVEEVEKAGEATGEAIEDGVEGTGDMVEEMGDKMN